MVDVLERLRVGEIAIRTEGLALVPEATPFDEVIRIVARSSETLFLVTNREGKLTGVFNLRDIRLALTGHDWAPLVLADDLASRPVVSVTPDDDLHTALRRLTDLNSEEIPVVAQDDPMRPIGILSRRDLVAAYSSQIDALRTPTRSENAG